MEKSPNKLGSMPIAALLLKMSVPMMVSMLVQALYNIVDSMFVAQISENALAAVSIAFPVQTVMGAIAVGTGVGTNAFVSRSFGSGDAEGAEKAANVQLFLSFCYTLIFAAVGLFGVRSFFQAQTDIEEIIGYGTDYLTIVCIFCAGCFFCQNFEKLLVATGNSAQSMMSQASGAVFNIIFDWLLIFGIGPFPALGIRGAAIATVLGQLLSAIVAAGFVMKCSGGIKFHFSKMLPNAEIIRSIYSVGIPSMLTIGLNSLMSFSMNQILLGFSTTATAVFGIWLKLQSFGFMPVFGMNNGTIAIFSYNYGAGNIERVRKTLRLALILGLSVTSSAALIYILIPGALLSMFDASDYMMEIGMSAVRICCLSLPFGAASIILSSSFQSLGKARYSLFVNFCRQALFLLPAAWLLSLSSVLQNIWYSVIIAESLTLLVAMYLNRKVQKLLDVKFN